jgi:hypothetical protein
MGGPGSGNFDHWWRGRRKTTVEACYSLDAHRWARAGVLRAGAASAGAWPLTRRGGATAAIRYAVTATPGAPPAVRLSVPPAVGGFEEVPDAGYLVGLTTTRPRIGGVRWRFLCPRARAGGARGRRVRKLCLPPGGRHFGCRLCHDLTYTSCQRSNQRDAGLRRLAEGTWLGLAEIAGAMGRPRRGRRPGREP